MPAALTAIACLLAAHVGLGCGTPARTFFVVQNQAPAQGTDCVIPGDRGANARGRGLLDAGLLPADTSTGYLLFPLLENDFPAEGSGDHEPNRIVLSGFDVAIAPVGVVPPATQAWLDALAAEPAGSTQLQYSQPWSGTIDPGQGLASASVEIFPAQLARGVLATGDLANNAHLTFIVTVQPHGAVQSGTVVGDSFHFPVDLCAGCLIARIDTCPVSTPPTATGNVCNLAQDAPVDCCLDTGVLVCPSPVATSP